MAFANRIGNPVVRWSDVDNPIRNEYSPYGQQLVQTDQKKHRGAYGYTGVHSNDDTGLIYMQARYQNPIAGSFLTPDPARDFNSFLPHSYNLYRYTSNNPMNSWDPTGLGETSDDQVNADSGGGEWGGNPDSISSLLSHLTTSSTTVGGGIPPNLTKILQGLTGIGFTAIGGVKVTTDNNRYGPQSGYRKRKQALSGKAGFSIGKKREAESISMLSKIFKPSGGTAPGGIG